MPKLDAKRWQLAQELLDRLEILPETEHARWLSAADPQVREEAESLLAAGRRQGDFLQTPALVTSVNTAAAPSLPGGSRIGAFRIESLIGRGGMAEVYRAHRDAGDFEQTVAIKLVRREAAEQAETFNRERSILAALEHPGIARLYDGGVSDDGRPYMVMEYVEGADLIAHARERQLGLGARLQLFRQVCEAIAHAHRYLVIHRDLKPGNIRVTPSGEVKLLDFGIAKLLDTSSTATSGDAPETRMLMTPEFAAPEQLRGEPVSTASDIYSLGAVLYQLLAGVPPFQTGGQSLALALDLLLRGDPPGLTQAAASNPSAPIAPRLLQGDLEAIVARALRREPTERYASVGELWADLARHLRHEPVLARRGNRVYLLSRLVRRHRLAVAAAVISLSAIVAGLGTALWQARQAQAEAQKARVQSERTSRIKNLLLAMFIEQNPGLRSSSAAVTSPDQLLLRGLAASEQDLAADPQLAADFLDDIGALQLAFGDISNADTTLLRAERARVTVYGEDSLAHVATLHKRVRLKIIAGKFNEALPLGEQAQAILHRLELPQHPDGARIRLELAMYMIPRPDGAKWLADAQAAWRDIEAAEGPESLEVARALSHLATVLEQARKDPEARAVAEDALARSERIQGPEGALLPLSLRVIGILDQRSGDYAHADTIFARGIEITRRHYGAVNGSLSDLLKLRASNSEKLGRLEQSARYFKDAEAALPAGDVAARAALQRALGQLELRRGRPEPAERALREAYALYRNSKGDNDGYTWFVAGQWGDALRAQGRLDEAEKIQRQAVQRMAEIMGPEVYQNVFALDGLAATLSLRGRHDEALRLSRRALKISEHIYPGGHPISQDRRLSLAKLLAAAGNPAARAEELALFETVIGYAQGAKPGETERLVAWGEALIGRGRIRLSKNQAQAALADFEAGSALVRDDPRAAAMLKAATLLHKQARQQVARR